MNSRRHSYLICEGYQIPNKSRAHHGSFSYIFISGIPSLIPHITRYSRACTQYSEFLHRTQLQKLLKEGYTDHTFKYNSTAMNWLTVTKYPFLKWQYILSLLYRFFSSIIDKTFTTLDNEQHGSRTAWSKPSFCSVHVVHLFIFLYCVICLFVFVMRLESIVTCVSGLSSFGFLFWFL